MLHSLLIVKPINDVLPWTFEMVFALVEGSGGCRVSSQLDLSCLKAPLATSTLI
jgi:hypothetical protein